MNRIIHTTITILFLFLFFAGCSGQRSGDLPELKDHKTLRVIVRPGPIAFLPRNANPVTIDREIAEDLAKELGLELALIVVEDYDQMIDKLLSGEGDIIAASMTATKSRQARAAFSIPYLYVNELLITQTLKDIPKKIEDLGEREICVRKASSYMETLAEIKKRVPTLVIREIAESLDTETIVDKVAQGECFATVADSNYWSAFSLHNNNLIAPLVLAKERSIALAMRPEAKILKQKVNEFLISRSLTGHRQEIFSDDLDGLKKRKVLRMITRNNAMTYFIYRGTQVGFEYELIKRFADRQKMRLEIVIPPNHANLISWLNEGRGDIIAAAMTITENRAKDAAFTIPYNYVEEVVVVREDEDRIARPEDLNGRTVHVRKSSSFYKTLIELKETVKGLKIAIVSEDLETEEILAGVEEGKWDITVCDSNLLEIEQSYGRKIKAAFGLKKSKLGWAVRKKNKLLLKTLNRYIKKEYRGLFYNTTKQKFFENKKFIAKAHDDFRSDVSGRISPYDDLVKKYAAMYDTDWRLIVAQMYQESKFDPDAVSWAGARGLMQITSRTAKELGVGDIREPEAAIHAGTKYMYQLIKRFNPKIPLKDRIRFALASYNAGYSHVADARRLARRMGWSPDRWFGNVERAILLLEKREYYRKARFGFCRGSETVRYVSAIQSLYDAYVEHIPT
jgi:membrane-bound lytic murein transglycosylase F